jgi:ABC-type Fe3+-hydroxamate transport system substrate-binding protein
MGRNVNIPNFPERIISLVPSQTELLFDLGLGSRVIGITKFCIHPESWHRSKTKIGGTKQLNFAKINELNPDLIICNKEENNESQVKNLMKKYPVWVSDISNLDESFSMINSIGEITNSATKSAAIVSNVRQEFAKLGPLNSSKKVLYLIWKNPYIAAGKNTFINNMILACGLINCVLNTRYPQLTNKEIKQLNPEIIFLSSEPYPFKEKHIYELQELLPNTLIILVNGELFSWYGSRLLRAPAYFLKLLSKI